MNIFELIKENYAKMSKGQKKIADFITGNYTKASYLTAAKLGELTGVSESTVVRFAFELGFEGYPEMVTAIRDYTGSKLTTIERISVMNDQIGADDAFEKILAMDIEKLKKTLDTADKKDFYKAVDTLCGAQNIYVIGARSAAVLARSATFSFTLIFESVKLVHTTSTSEMFEQILPIGKTDVMIGMTFPRYSKHTVNAMKFAKESGAKVIGLTDSTLSPVAEFSDSVLIAKSNLTSFADSLVAPMSVLNALIVAVGIRKRDYVEENYKRMEEIYEQYEVYKTKGER
ncbi:MAG: MurR/RpiR family transcriptional regulator [Ruminococcus sp.]|jgi:DNA-binding MurR/RpiR family transcriptional regulator|nr:MurR/RpiR family transcriptional regulator [Ruminococcus sp.]